MTRNDAERLADLIARNLEFLDDQKSPAAGGVRLVALLIAEEMLDGRMDPLRFLQSCGMEPKLRVAQRKVA